MSSVALLAGVGVASAAGAVVEVGRWWARCRVAARGSLPRPETRAPDLVVRWLADAGVRTDPVLVLRLWCAALVGALVLALLSPAGRIITGLAAIGPPAAVLLGRGRSRRHRAAQIPVALDAVAAALRSGSALRTAIGEAASVGPPLGPELDEIVRRAESGVPLAAAIDAWADAHPDRASGLGAAALAVAARVGGPSADAIEAAAASVRDQAATDAEAASSSVQARLSAVVLSAAPIVFALVLSGVDPASSRFLFATPAGWICLVAGIGLDLLGALWMRHLMRSTP